MILYHGFCAFVNPLSENSLDMREYSFDVGEIMRDTLTPLDIGAICGKIIREKNMVWRQSC